MLLGLHMIPLDRLTPSPKNPRNKKRYQHLDELAASLKVRQLTPLLVRPVRRGAEEISRGGGEWAYEIAAGHRRYLAARQAKLPGLEAVSREMSDAEFLHLLARENLDRENLSLLEECDAIGLLVEEAGGEIKAVADELGRSSRYVAERLRLRELPEEMFDLLGQPAVTPEVLRHLARMPDAVRKELCLQVARDVKDGALVDAHDVLSLIHGKLRDLKQAPFPVADTQLQPAAGPCTSCPKRTSAQAELFEGAKGDACLDAGCWEAKATAHVARAKVQIAAKLGQEPVAIRGAYGGRARKGELLPHQYDGAAKGDKGAVPAVVADGPSAGNLVYVKPKRERAPAKAEPSEKEAARAAKEELEREAELEAVAILADSVRAAPRATIEAALLYLVERSDIDVGACQALYQKLGWKMNPFDPVKLRRLIAGLSDRVLGQALTFLLGFDMAVCQYDAELRALATGGKDTWPGLVKRGREVVRARREAAASHEAKEAGDVEEAAKATGEKAAPKRKAKRKPAGRKKGGR